MSAAISPLRRPAVVAALAASAVAVVGALETDIGAWYYALHKPAWQPPDWLFGPAWTVIFALTAIAGATYWPRDRDRRARWITLGAFAVNGALNILWSLLFFRLHRPDWALYEVGWLWLSVLAVLARVRRASGIAAWLLSPYLAWVAFAALLNLTIVRLNGPFG